MLEGAAAAGAEDEVSAARQSLKGVLSSLAEAGQSEGSAAAGGGRRAAGGRCFGARQDEMLQLGVLLLMEESSPEWVAAPEEEEVADVGGDRLGVIAGPLLKG